MSMGNLRRAAALLILALAAAGPLGGQERPRRSATVIGVDPQTFLWRGGGTSPLRLAGALYAGDRITTDEHGLVRMALVDGSVFYLQHNSDFTMKALGADGAGGTVVQLLRGIILGAVKHLTGNEIQTVETPYGVTAVKGTQYQVEAASGHTELKVLQGRVELSSPSGHGTVSVGPGEVAESYPDRVGRVRQLNRQEMDDLRAAFKAMVDQAKASYLERVRSLRQKR